MQDDVACSTARTWEELLLALFNIVHAAVGDCCMTGMGTDDAVDHYSSSLVATSTDRAEYKDGDVGKHSGDRNPANGSYALVYRQGPGAIRRTEGTVATCRQRRRLTYGTLLGDISWPVRT